MRITRFLFRIGSIVYAIGFANAQDIQVVGKPTVLPVSNFQRMNRSFDLISKTNGSDSGLRFHIFATLEPGDKVPREDFFYLATPKGNIPLFRHGSNEVILPEDISGNPNVMAVLSQGETVRFQSYVTINANNYSSISDGQSRKFMSELDEKIDQTSGLIGGLLSPSTKEFFIVIAPKADLKSVTSGSITNLVHNQSENPYTFWFQPKKFSRDTSFESTSPFLQMGMKFPVPISPWHYPG